jgi:hypothetical protein
MIMYSRQIQLEDSVGDGIVGSAVEVPVAPS